MTNPILMPPCPCGDTDCPDPITHPAPAIGDLMSDTTTAVATVDVTAATTDVQAQIGRVDTKASMLLAGASTALSVGIAVLAKTRLPLPTTIGVTLAVALIGAAVALLITAVRPDLRGNHGFVRYAAAPNPTALHTDLTATDVTNTEEKATRLWILSRIARRKYTLVRVAVDLLRVTLTIAALTAALTLFTA